ncbi:MAG: DUF58 domain-containing protein [Lachnospira sp.]|nr:DUF58 domain-containing protein [Lachnospira sp.]
MKSRKVIYILCLLGVFILNVFYVNYQFYVLLLLVILIPVASFILFMIAKHSLELMFYMPGRMLTKGKSFSLLVKMSNNVPILLSNSEVRFSAQFSNDPQVEHQKIIMNTFYDNHKEQLEISAAHCGILEVHVDQVHMYDYLKIFGKVKRFKGNLHLSVFPELLPTSERNNGEVLESMEYSSDQWLILNGDSDEIVDYREYQDGDSMNKIHWKLSVKSDDLIVKKFGDEDDRCIRILVDLTKTKDPKFREYLDRIYQMAYSIGHYYVKVGMKTSFVLWDSRQEKLVEWMFTTEEELQHAVIGLMQQKCSENAGGKTEAAYEESGLRSAEKPFWITSKNYDSRDYQVINVIRDDLEQLMETLYEI